MTNDDFVEGLKLAAKSEGLPAPEMACSFIMTVLSHLGYDSVIVIRERSTQICRSGSNLEHRSQQLALLESEVAYIKDHPDDTPKTLVQSELN